MTLYSSIQILLVLLTFSLLYLLIRGLGFAFTKLNFSPQKKRNLLYFTTLGLTCWLGLIAALSFLGFFENFEVLPPRVLLGTIPIFFLIIFLLFSKSFSKVIAQIPPAWLIYIQSFRIVMEIILWLGFIDGFVPFQMTFVGFNLDIVVGFTAILGGFVFFGKGRFRKFEAFIWNIFGIILLINIVIISAISTPSPLRVFFNEPANVSMAYFPFIWIPCFIVPFALAMHLFSLKQIWKQKR